MATKNTNIHYLDGAAVLLVEDNGSWATIIRLERISGARRGKPSYGVIGTELTCESDRLVEGPVKLIEVYSNMA